MLQFNSVSTLSFTYAGGGGNHAFTIATAPTPGPDAVNTTFALASSAQTLRNLMDRRLIGLSFMASYDCQTFDKHGVCLSFQARYGNLDSRNEGAGVLTAAYRVTPQVRLGGFIDYRASEKVPGGISLSHDLPTFGAFLGYNQNSDGTGFQGKALAAYQRGDAAIAREGSDDANTESGSGKANLNSYIVSGELAWGFAVASSMRLTPYVGVRYSESTRGAYTETTSESVEFPISYDRFHQRLTTATAGVRLSGMLTEKVGYQVGAGVEYDLKRDVAQYSGTSEIPDLEAFSLTTSGVYNRTRGAGSVGLFYQAQKNARLTANVGLRNQAFSSQAAVSAMVGYQVAF